MLFFCIWRNVEVSCHKHFVVVSCEQQTTPLTSDACHQLAMVRRSCVYIAIRFGVEKLEWHDYPMVRKC